MKKNTIKCDVCHTTDGRVSNVVNGIYVNTCCVGFMRNLAKLNNRTLKEEIIEQENWSMANRISSAPQPKINEL